MPQHDFNIKKRAVFLDRDGVINLAILKNAKPYPPAKLEDLRVAKEVLPALQMMKSLGYLLIGATNQPDVARGTMERRLVEVINQQLLTTLPLDDIRVCYHDDKDGCQCRKPSPGLLLTAAKDYNIDLTQSIMIGDRWKDIKAGQQAGCKTIWIDHHYQEQKPEQPDLIVRSLFQAAEWIEKINFQRE